MSFYFADDMAKIYLDVLKSYKKVWEKCEEKQANKMGYFYSGLYSYTAGSIWFKLGT